MSQRVTAGSLNTPTLFLVVSLALAGAMSAVAAAEELLSRSPERGGIGLEIQQLQFNDHFNRSGRPIRPGLLSRLDERLSIIVTDKASTSAITFSEVMGKLADDMRVDKLTLFRRWWDTANNDTQDNLFCNSAQQINGFPYQCPRAEGRQAHVNPFDCANPCAGYTAIAFVNRFDFADKDRGQHCGEFRIVFARNSGLGAAKNCEFPAGERLLIIFEALVPNPRPPHSPVKPHPDDIFVNLAGCRPIVEFWLSLSDPNMSTTDRGTALRHFFLKGLPYADVGPVVDARNYAGGPASGQIRTNQRMQPAWTLREFKTYAGRIVPVTVKSNPGNSLFWKNPPEKDPREIEFADYLVRKDSLDNLRGVTSSIGKAGEKSIDTFAFGLTVPGVDHLNSFESNAGRSDGNVVVAFDSCLLSNGCLIEKKITDALNGSPLSANNITHRIRTQTCAGCHHFSNGDTELGVDCPERWPSTLCEGQSGIWPSTLGGFTHVSENETEDGADSDVFDLDTLDAITPEALRSKRPERISHLSYRGPDGEKERYRISETLKFLLLPPRFENMVLYLNQFDAPP